MKRIQFKSNSPYLMPLPPFFIDDLRFFKWRCDLKWFWCKFDVELIRIETVASWPHIHNTATLSTHVCNWLVPLDRATGIQRQPGMKKLAHNQEYETWRQDSCGAGGCQSPFVMYHGDTYHLVEDMATVRVASHFSVMQNMTQNQLGVVYHAIQISHRFGVITDSDIRSSKTAMGLTTSQPCPIWRPASFSCVWQTKNAPCANSSLQRAMAWYENHNGDGQNHQIKCVAWINQSIMTQSSLNLAHIDTKLSIMRAATSFMHRLLLNAQSRVPYENQNGAAFRTTEIRCATSAYLPPDTEDEVDVRLIFSMMAIKNNGTTMGRSKESCYIGKTHPFMPVGPRWIRRWLRYWMQGWYSTTEWRVLRWWVLVWWGRLDTNEPVRRMQLRVAGWYHPRVAVLRCAWDGSPISDVAHVSSAGVSDSSKKNFIAGNCLGTHRRTGLRWIWNGFHKKKFPNFASKFLL